MSTGVIDRARAGDPDAFAAATALYRRELHLHCYRMLGSVDDADEVLQETLLAAWRGLADFAGRSSLRSWLYAIATRRCLNAIRDAKRRPPPALRPPFAVPDPSGKHDVTWLQPYPDRWLDEAATDPAREHERRATIELAFIAALQRLPPRQTAAVVLCDVLDFSAAEAAAMLGADGPTAVKGLLQRARATLARDRPPTAGSAADDELAARFAEAFATDDIGALLALLTQDAWLRMPPAAHAYHGTVAIGAFLAASAQGRGRPFALRSVAVNRQPAFVTSLDGAPTGVLVLSTDGAALRAITHFLDPGLAARVAAA